MTDANKHFTRDTLMALYLLRRALRQGTECIVLTEDFFRSYWNLERPTRLYESYIRAFIASIRPFFPFCVYRHRTAALYVGGADEVNKYYKMLRKQPSLKPPGLMPPLPELKTETFDAPPQSPELDENLIAEEIAEMLIKHTAGKNPASSGSPAQNNSQ